MNKPSILLCVAALLVLAIGCKEKRNKDTAALNYVAQKTNDTLLIGVAGETEYFLIEVHNRQTGDYDYIKLSDGVVKIKGDTAQLLKAAIVNTFEYFSKPGVIIVGHDTISVRPQDTIRFQQCHESSLNSVNK